ncbi:MAG: hypothetical protein HYR91_08200, partial [Flavobacteriia bacterium]|nr:hypothetical protein [Flavobacteriia bacterium]
VITNGYSVSIGVLDLTATGVLTLSTSTLTISSTATIAGTTTISTGTIDANSTFNATGGTITFTGAGNLYLSGTTITSLGTFTCSTSTVTLDGSASQTINSSTDPNFYNLTLNNTSGGAIGLSTTVKNNFTFAAGATNFSLQGYTLTIGTATTDGTITGADADSYFVAYDNAGTIGKLKYFINNNVGYTYPIGDLSNYTPLTWTLNSNGGLSSAYLTVYTKAAPPTGMSASITEYLNRSWDVTSSGMTTPNYNISYTYIQTDVVSSETNFMPFKITGSTVVKPSNSSFTNYNSAEGTGSVNTGTNVLTWTGLTTFSMFGAAGNGAVALPVEILNFDVKLYQKNAKISWKTANEINNDYFTVEKSSDGINFRDLQIVDGSGNSNYTLKYSIIDHDATSGIYYYRLKQTDFNGEEKLSTIISIEIKTNTSEVIMTVNTLGQEVNESYSGIVFDIYSDGTSVKRIQ